MTTGTQILAMWLALGGVLEGPGGSDRPALKAHIGPGLAAIISGLDATPETIDFSATDPDLGSISGTSAVITWDSLAGLSINTWTLSVQADAPTFSGCTTVPVSAVTVTCTAATITGLDGSGTCSGPISLSTTAQQVASGEEPSLAGSYEVDLDFALQDSWKYIAALSPACTLQLTYTAVTP